MFSQACHAKAMRKPCETSEASLLDHRPQPQLKSSLKSRWVHITISLCESHANIMRIHWKLETIRRCNPVASRFQSSQEERKKREERERREERRKRRAGSRETKRRNEERHGEALLEEQTGTRHKLAMRKPCEQHAKSVRRIRGEQKKRKSIGGL